MIGWLCLGVGVGFFAGFWVCAVLQDRYEKERERMLTEKLTEKFDALLANVRVARPRGVREERPN